MTEVTVANAHPRKRVSGGALVRLLRAVLAGEHVRDARISLVLIDRHRCRRMNERFLGHRYETDVFSFPLEPLPALEGEVYVNLDRAATQARRYAVPFATEVARLAVHGTLHLLGYDDHRPADIRKMRAAEDRHLHRAHEAGILR